MLLSSQKIEAQVKEVFSPRYNETIRGEVSMIANNVVSQSPTANYNGEGDNQNFDNNVFVDIDNDPSTFNSSNAVLSNPRPGDSCLEIEKVMLYWVAADKGVVINNAESENVPNWNFNDAKIRLPGQTNYTIITADEVIYRGRDDSPHFINDPYVCYKDITEDVKNLNSPFGTYQIANVEARTGFLVSHTGGNTGTSGGWQIVVVYSSPDMKLRNITLSDGYVHIANTTSSLDFVFNGFQTVPNGNINANVLIGALEGDRGLNGDMLQIEDTNGDFVNISTPGRANDNFFNSKITIGSGGGNFTNRTPASTNTLGFDAALFPLNNPGKSILANNQTSASLRLTSTQETYGLYVLGFSIEVYQPDLDISLNATPTSLTPGPTPTTVTFNTQLVNNGNDNAENVVLSTTIGPEAELVLPITGLPTGVSYTYNETSRLLTFTVDNGVLTSNSQPLDIDFQVNINDECYFLENGSDSGEFSIQLDANYHGEINPTNQSTQSSHNSDVCSNGDLNSTIITINDPNPPTWETEPGELDTTVECNNNSGLNAAQNLSPVSNCENLTPIKTSGEFVQNGSCPTNGTYTNTFTFTDAYGNVIDTYTQVITVQDTQGPVIDTTAFDFSVQCDGNGNTDDLNDWLDTNGGAVAFDNCNNPVVWSNDYSGLSDDCGGTGSAIVTFTATDACGNTSTTSASFTIIDTLPPTIVGFPSNVDNTQPSCVDVPVLSFENYTEETGDGDNTTFLEGEVFRFTNIAPGVDALVNILETVGTTIPVLDDNSTSSDSFRPKTAFSIANNGDRAYTEYRIDFVDAGTTNPTTLPEFYSNFNDIDGGNNYGEVNWTQFTNSYTVNDPTDLTITEEGPWIVATAGTTEYPGVSNAYPQANFSTRNTNSSSFRFRLGVEARRNNVSGGGRQHNIEFTCISNYTNAVTISEEITIECDELEPAETLTATDECGTATIDFNETTTPGTCENEFVVERTWTATDECGNTTTRTLIINVVDTTPPTFTVPEDVTINCEQDPNDLTLTGDVTDEADNCDTTLEATFTDTEDNSSGECSSETIITRTWTLTDDCNNTTSAIQTITVQDSTAPTFTVPADITINCEQDPNDLTLTGDVTNEDDNCDNDLEATYTDTASVGSCPNESIITREWTLVDDCGNSTTFTQTITVEDNTAPYFVGVLPQNITAECDQVPEASVLLFDDNCSSINSKLLNWENETWPSGSLSNSYNIDGTNVSITIQDPTGSLTSGTPVTGAFYQGDEPTIENTLILASSLPVLQEDTITLTITLGNSGVGVTNTFFKLFDVDGEINNFYRQENYTITGSLNGTTVMPALSATDNQIITGNDVYGIDPTTPSGGNSTEGVVSVAFSEAVDTITIVFKIINSPNINPNSAPGFGLHNISFSEVNENPLPTATFNETITEGSCSSEYTITRTWIATDSCNNQASHTQIINVQDSTDPTFTVPADITINCEQDPNDLTLTGDVTTEADNCSGALQATFSDATAAGTCANESIITRTWSLTDECGNTTTAQQVITIQDTTAPTFTVPADVTINCEQDPNDLTLTGDVTDEADNCATTLEATFSDTTAAGACENEAIITRTWTLTDNCDNITTLVQTITIEDNTAPDISACNVTDQTVDC
ncbi:MAG: hypothetical protein BM549_13705, partial [Lacinutrix sp. MedPE-SW]